MSTQIDPKIERKLRKVTSAQLQALYIFGESKEPYVTTSRIDDSTSTAGGTALGGLISSLSRIKTDKGNLIKAVGTTIKGDTKWILNEDVITKEQLKDLVFELMKYADKNE